MIAFSFKSTSDSGTFPFRLNLSGICEFRSFACINHTEDHMPYAQVPSVESRMEANSTKPTNWKRKTYVHIKILNNRRANTTKLFAKNKTDYSKYSTQSYTMKNNQTTNSSKNKKSMNSCFNKPTDPTLFRLGQPEELTPRAVGNSSPRRSSIPRHQFGEAGHILVCRAEENKTNLYY